MNESNGSSVIFDSRLYIHHNAILPINIDGSGSYLSTADTFAVEGLFDLFIPPLGDTTEAYGVMLTDRAPVNPGNDQLEMRLIRRPDGKVGIQFAKLTYSPDTVTPFEFVLLSNAVGYDSSSPGELLLRLAKNDTNSNAITASYAFLDSTDVVNYLADPFAFNSFTDFATTQTIFNGEGYTRAGFFARHYTSVPEPASIAMFAFGLVLLGALRRRKRCIQYQ